MAATVEVSGAFGLDDTTGIAGFIVLAAGGAAGDCVSTYQDAGNKGVWVIVSKA